MPARSRAAPIAVRPDQRYIWYGPSLLLLDHQGVADEHAPLSGLYFRETRYLRRLRLELNGELPWLCAIGGSEPRELLAGLSYPELSGGGGGGTGVSGEEVPTNAAGIPWRAVELMARYRLDFRELWVEVVLTNRSRQRVELDAAWRLSADYADLQEAQAEERQQEAPVEAMPSVDPAGGAALRFRYGHPDLPLETSVETRGPARWEASADQLKTRLVLAPQWPITLSLHVTAQDTELLPDLQGERQRDARLAVWRRRLTRVTAPGEQMISAAVNQAMDDLGSFALLEGEPDEWLAPAAGMPAYPALFGRDSLTATWQATVLDRGEQLSAALTRLQGYQGTVVDPTRDEEPGRIVHSVRRGPLARLGINPFDRYYADFASPFMFVISLAQLYAWTGRMADIERHWDAACRVLDWARDYGDRDGDGYLEYLTQASQGPQNQGWKDSGDCILYPDGRQVPAPIGTCEIQGYWFAAQQLFAVLCAARGRLGDARAYWQSAMELKARFNRDWWVPEESFIALAMDRDKQLVRTVTSNVGHCITAGIIDDEHLPAVVDRMFAADLFSGWGIRTLSANHPSYNPVGYHLGSVWSVENGTIAFGLRRFGFDARAVHLIRAVLDLAALYDHFRVPECVGGYSRADWIHPSAYPRATIPQAWNQSALPLFVQTLLGLQPVAPLELLVVDPVLPPWLPELTLKGLRVGGATITLRCWRDSHGRSHAEVLRARGKLRVIRQPPPESLTAGIGDRFKAFADGLLHH
ncbi:MAG TPA: glycogen debranching N-terminal domain-containing protein [Gemmatimonadales bacterium]|nr:glycogen debranching N-terminal domain-containing protein [Gemmatimonadales bacterium]